MTELQRIVLNKNVSLKLVKAWVGLDGCSISLPLSSSLTFSLGLAVLSSNMALQVILSREAAVLASECSSAASVMAMEPTTVMSGLMPFEVFPISKTDFPSYT